jgi:hypothetical protein
VARSTRSVFGAGSPIIFINIIIRNIIIIREYFVNY